MRPQHTYSGALKMYGQVNEDRVLKFLMGLEPVSRVEDVRAIKKWQSKEVDFILYLKNGGIRKVEIKADKNIRANANLGVETHRITSDGKYLTGWGWKSEADDLIVRNPVTGMAFIFDFATLRKEIGSYSEKSDFVAHKTVQTSNKMTTFLMTIPMKELTFESYYI